MNNRFEQYAEEFIVLMMDHDDEEGSVEDAALAFIAKKGIDPAWEDEAVAVIIEAYEDTL